MSDSVNLDKLQPIDFCEVLDRIGGDTAFLKDLLNIYFQEYAEKKRLLEEAVAREDFKQVSELGHSLKGASANLGLARLQRVAFSLETAGRERQIQLAREAVRSFDVEVQTLKVFLEGNPPGKFV
jgi:HPt (histidine-containing phosphotransfer) domain-containing protein